MKGLSPSTATVIVAIAVVVLAAAIPAWAHPKPGAHADVRISVSERSVRVDCLMNLLFADQLVRSERARRDDVLPEEEGGLRAALAEYFACAEPGSAGSVVFNRANSVSVAGQAVRGELTTFEVVHPEPETRPGFVQNPALLLPRVRTVVEYRLEQPARQVSLVWGTYPRDFQAQDRDLAPPGEIEAVLTFADQLDLLVFRPGEPEYTWHRPPERVKVDPEQIVPVGRAGLEVPVVSLGLVLAWAVGGVVLARMGRFAAVPGVLSGLVVLVGAVALAPVARVPMGPRAARAPEPAAAAELFHALHSNIYRAFDFTSEDDIYTALAKSVDGPLLDRVYSDVYHGLVMQEEGGAMSRVRAVTPVSTRVLEAEGSGGAGAFRVVADWTVDGVVYHWGHSHTRVNQYLAEYTVARTDSGWRIVGARPIEQRRVSSGTTDSAARPAAGGSEP